MNEKSTIEFGEHDEIALLLPWYANRSLPEDELRRVERHLKSCLVCHRELKSIEPLQAAFQADSQANVAAHMSFRNLQHKLGAMPITPMASVRGPIRMSAKWRPRPPKREVVGWAMAASIVLLVGPSLLKQVESWVPSQYETLSSKSKVNSAQLEVVFAPEIMAKQRDQLIESINGEQVGEPNSVGAYRIRLRTPSSAADPSAAVALLRQKPGVLLAEPIVSAEAEHAP